MVKREPDERIDMIELEDFLYYTLKKIPDRLPTVDLENKFGAPQCLSESLIQDVRITQ